MSTTPQEPQTPKRLMEILRKRRGLNDDDTSQDQEIHATSPLEKLQDLAGWELGDPYWADKFLRWAKGCGFEIRESPLGQTRGTTDI